MSVNSENELNKEQSNFRLQQNKTTQPTQPIRLNNIKYVSLERMINTRIFA